MPFDSTFCQSIKVPKRGGEREFTRGKIHLPGRLRRRVPLILRYCPTRSLCSYRGCIMSGGRALQLFKGEREEWARVTLVRSFTGTGVLCWRFFFFFFFFISNFFFPFLFALPSLSRSFIIIIVIIVIVIYLLIIQLLSVLTFWSFFAGSSWELLVGCNKFVEVYIRLK